MLALGDFQEKPEVEVRTPVESPPAFKKVKPGLEQVYPSPNGDQSILDRLKNDIIALHGLDAQSPKTWLAWEDEHDETSRGVFWLAEEHMLPEAMPNSRILAYNWAASYDKAQGVSMDTFEGQAKSLLDRIYVERKKRKRMDKPIIFIASCFGGLLLAKALTICTRSTGPRKDEFGAILNCTIGAAFLGTPFRGSSETGCSAAAIRAAIAAAGDGPSSKELIQYLKPTSPDDPSPLDDLVTGFAELVNDRVFGFNIACFYENDTTDLEVYRNKIPEQFWEELKINKKGSIRLVTKSSACLDGTDMIGLDLRHNMMHKFNSPDNDGFERLVERLDKFQRESVELLSRRGRA